MISARLIGNFHRLEAFLQKDCNDGIEEKVTQKALEGLELLKQATPVKTGLTRDSWDVRVEKTGDKYKIAWFNTNVDKYGVPVIVYLEYGHGTRTGGYVPARYFIKKTLTPFYKHIAEELGPEVIEK